MRLSTFTGSNKYEALLMFVFLVFATFSGYSQEPVYTARFSPDIDNNINGFWEYLPRDYDSDVAVSYPLLVYLHGAGDMGTVQDLTTMEKINRNGPAKLIANGIFPESFNSNGKSFRFIFLAPQIKNGVTGTTSIISPATIDSMVEYAKKTYRVDVTRIYVTGMSMGGGAVWDYAGSLSGSKKIAAIAVAAGAADLSPDESANIAAERIAVLATHNTVDGIVSYTRTVANIARIKADIQSPPDPVPVYWNTPGQKNPQELDDGEHNVWTRTFEDITAGVTLGGNLRDTLGKNVYEWMLDYVNFSDIIVPLIWEHFTARRSEDQVLLEWTVSAQQNVNQFIIEKSNDNRNFRPVDSLSVQPGEHTNTYQYTDISTGHVEVFYRIKQTDANEGFSVSVVRKVAAAPFTPGAVIYPNPFNETIYLTLPSMPIQSLNVKIMDVQGRLMRAVKIRYTQNAQAISGMGALTNGWYILMVADEHGKIVLKEKLLKQ